MSEQRSHHALHAQRMQVQPCSHWRTPSLPRRRSRNLNKLYYHKGSCQVEVYAASYVKPLQPLHMVVWAPYSTLANETEWQHLSVPRSLQPRIAAKNTALARPQRDHRACRRAVSPRCSSLLPFTRAIDGLTRHMHTVQALRYPQSFL